MQTMHHGYIRLWQTGPSSEVQWDRIHPHGVEQTRLHLDDQRPTRRKKRFSGQPGITLREQAVNVLRPGDRLIVACPAVIGNSEQDIMKALGWIEQQGATLFDAESGGEVTGISAAMDYAQRGVRQLAQMRTNPARRALAETPRKTGPRKRPLGVPLKDLLEMWRQPEVYTVGYIAEQAGLKPRTIYLLFEGIPRPRKGRTEGHNTGEPADARAFGSTSRLPLAPADSSRIS